ncbi:hypothetical protein ABFS83_14G155700 [Erythranthe nasuta]
MAANSNNLSVHMNAGDGETSYTNNSAPQKIGISKSLHVLDEAIKDMITDIGFPKCFKIADLGCSSGPNSLSVISRIIEKIEHLSKEKNGSPNNEYEVFLSDLHGNDFNNLFKMLPDFYEKLDINNPSTRCFLSGLPGSFYGRLFPSNSLDFVYSSYSLHWLSQVPKGVESNKENIHIAKKSPPEVFEAYSKQYNKDLTNFLESRGLEVVKGGRMVLTFSGGSIDGRSIGDIECLQFTILADTLVDMVAEGLIKEADLHSFNLPMYAPSKQEIEEIVLSEGSFNLDKLDEFVLPWDIHVTSNDNLDDKYRIGELVLKFIRAFMEPILAAHFGNSVMDEVYGRYGKKLGELQSEDAPPFPNVVICLTKK